jgi:hypothetical protein
MNRERCNFMSGRSFAGKAFVALSLGAGLMLAAGTASAQVKLPPDHCEGALLLAEQIKQRYDISPRLEASFQKFRLSNCDVLTSFERDTEVDVKAFLEFRLRFEAWKICNDDPMKRGCL